MMRLLIIISELFYKVRDRKSLENNRKMTIMTIETITKYQRKVT